MSSGRKRIAIVAGIVVLIGAFALIALDHAVRSIDLGGEKAVQCSELLRKAEAAKPAK